MVSCADSAFDLCLSCADDDLCHAFHDVVPRAVLGGRDRTAWVATYCKKAFTKRFVLLLNRNFATSIIVAGRQGKVDARVVYLYLKTMGIGGLYPSDCL